MKAISKYVLFLLIICFANPLCGQYVERLKAEGVIPKEFITPSRLKYKKQVADFVDEKDRKSDKKDKERFLLESGFEIDDILQSGVVLFNDPATVYVNKVLENLTIENNHLKKKKPRAYILNSPAVNAFATDQGIIFVTLGLLANLDNEAQLAFILSHELIHIKNKHSINKFIRSKAIDRGAGRQRNAGQVSVDQKIFKKSMYSRSLEEEADEEGLEIFLKSDYDPAAIINTFKILHYSYLPFEDLPFEKSFFEDEYYIFPKTLWLEEVNKIEPMEEDQEEEKKSSHPSSTKRLKKLKASVAAASNENKKAFLLPKEEFKSIQRRAQYQLPFLNLTAENFTQAVYTSYILLQNDPNNLALKKIIAKALYMGVKYKNYEEEDNSNSVEFGSEEEEEDSKIEGESHRVYHLLNEMSAKEITVLATKYNWNLYQQNEADKELKMMMDDLFVEFVGHFKDLNEFHDGPKLLRKQAEEEVDEKEEEDKEEDTEEKTIDLDKKLIKKNPESEYWKYAFVKELKTENFKKEFEEGEKAHQKKVKKERYYDSPAGERAYFKELRQEAKHGKKLGIKKVVVVNPFYLSLDGRKRESVQYIRSEEKQAYFRKTIKELAEMSNIKADLLDVTDLSSKDIEKFNDITEINSYFKQQMYQFDLSLTPGYNQAEVNAVADKYKTDYFLWTGVISLREKNNGWKYVGLSVLFPYFLPFTIANAATPKYDMMYYAILFDVKTGRRSILKMDYFDKRDSKTILKAHIYDVFHQINTEER